MKSPASISFSISKVYNEKKPKYFLRASAKVDFNVFYIIQYEKHVNLVKTWEILQE